MNNFSRIASKNWLSLVLIFLFTFSVSLVGARFVRSILVNNSSETPPNETAELDNSTTEIDSKPAANPIELQPIINSWISENNNYNSQIGIAIYDLDRNEFAAAYNADTIFQTDNLRNLLFAYDGYRQINSGVENPDTEIINATTYSSCLDDIIRMDDTICSEAILDNSDRAERIEKLISELDMTQTTMLGQSSTANDFTKLLQRLWEHRDLSLDGWAKLQDSMLDQPISNGIDWRQGLLSGFSTAKVYSKASGTQTSANRWTSYGNLALVDFVKLNRHFAVVVLTTNLTDLNNLSQLGTLIEGKVIEE